MTTSRIQHILTGLKGEIAREKDPERKEHLAVMGKYWNNELLSHSKLEFHDYEKGYYIDIKTCIQCGQPKHISEFRFHNTYLARKCGVCEDLNHKKNVFAGIVKKKANSYI